MLVLIWNGPNTIVGSAQTDASGFYATFGGLPTGTYFATTLNQSSYLNELYDDIPCPFFASCDPTTGTAIPVTEGTTTSGIDFALTPGGAIAGAITEQGTGIPLLGGVGIVDDTGAFVTSGFTETPGVYVSDDGLPSGTYFARSDVSPFHVNELYDDLPCGFFECDPTTGTPIAVTVGTTTGGIDFSLVEGGGVAGTVTEEAGGAPVPGILVVGLFDAGGNQLLNLFSFDGAYESFSGIPVGTYFSRTLNAGNAGCAEERYDNLPCLQTCPVAEGTPIAVVAGAVTDDIDYSLSPPPLFFDSLESGGLGYWSSVSGGVGCAHSICTPGGPLSAGCDPCAGAICAIDPFCCNIGWDGICVGEVTSVCGLQCP